MPIPPVRSDWVPDACSLPSIDRPLRIAEFDQFFAGGVRLLRRPAPARLELLLSDEAEVIKAAQRLGFTLDEVADLLAGTRLGTWPTASRRSRCRTARTSIATWLRVCSYGSD